MRFSNMLLSRKRRYDHSGNMEINCLKLLLDRWQGKFTEEVFNEIVVTLLQGETLLFLAASDAGPSLNGSERIINDDELFRIQNQVTERGLNVFVDFESISCAYGDQVFQYKPMRAIDVVNAVEENGIRKIRIHHGQKEPFIIKWAR